MFKKVNFNIGFVIILILILATSFSSFISNSDPYQIELSKGLVKPEWGHPFGFEVVPEVYIIKAVSSPSLTASFISILDISRERKSCVRCGKGVFMAVHKNRRTCGKCGDTEFI